mmetsp:Transcript_19404/g.57722  ORF Transcript_19404/g.57722 Transcript_19404/m.57722 type:complete len:119 (+) Transcript_19404:108-464(+)
MAGLDPEMQKTFDELQQRMVETRSQMQFADVQSQAKKMQIRRLGLTLTEIKTHDDACRMYDQVGRMFLVETKTQTTERLAMDIKDAEQQIKDLQEKKDYLERQYKDSEGNLRELLRHR